MHKVYGNSYCNIALADSVDCNGGAFRTRNPKDIIPVRFGSDGEGKLDPGTWRVLSEDLWNRQLLSTKIYTRAWVLQERMLSPRIVHFGKSQMFWDCSALSACEALPRGLPHALDATASTDRHWRGRIQITSKHSASNSKAPLIGPNDDSLETFWKSALLHYTSCELTNQLDKAVAIWSIAKLVRDGLGEEYGSGLWQHRLEEQLAWRMKDCGVAKTRIPELRNVAPSRSWASVKGAVVAHDRLSLPRCYTVRDHDEQTPISFQIQPYGDNRDNEPRLTKRHIAMAGYMGSCVLKQGTKPGTFGMDVVQHSHSTPILEKTGIFDAFPDELVSEDELSNRHYSFIVLAATANRLEGLPLLEVDVNSAEYGSITYSGKALLLSSHNHSGDCESGRNRYRRAGAVQFRNVGVKMWEMLTEAGRVKIFLE